MTVPNQIGVRLNMNGDKTAYIKMAGQTTQ